MIQKIVVVAYSSHTAINRKVWGLVSQKNDLTLVIPTALRFGKTMTPADDPASGDPPLVKHRLVGRNPRLYYFQNLWDTLVRIRPDVIFIENDPISFLCLYCCFYKIIFGTKIYCLTNENLSLSLTRIFSKDPIKLKVILLSKRILCWMVRPFISGIFCINYDGKKEFESLEFRNVRWVPLGYDPIVFREDAEIRNQVRSENNLTTFTFGYFGRIVPEKGLLMLLQTLRDLKEIPWRVLIDDFSRYTTPYIDEVKLYIEENNLGKYVVFFHANHQEIMRFMNACDLVVVPSFSTSTFKEQYGRVVQEAVACGCLTIVSNSGFLPHFFTNPFHIFNERDLDSLRWKINEVLMLDKTRLESLKVETMKNIQINFSISAQANIIEEAIA